ncbi:hypothetical protein J437_LFUL008397 [Ladona fulva]|uniref:Uncharacterized protein n=1 Tax=Ladona fulva TaxID=123851 RepID=A0A8K0NWX8_LADFU|nr:hypothetical protein J437_LFUL008397 [Ladona fulva]
MAAIISGPDPYRELEIYLQKMNEEIGEVFDKWNGGHALSSAMREESSPEENGVADLSESSPPDLFKSLPARKKRQWRRSRGESGKFATVAASSVKTSSTSACGSDAGMGWTELHSFIEAQLRQLAEEEDSGVPNSPLSPTAVNGVHSGGAFDSLTNGDHVGEEEDDPEENSVNYRRPSRRRSKEENSRAEKFVIDGEVWPKASNGAVRVNGNSHGSERAVQFDLQNGARQRECGKVWGGRRVFGNGCIPDRLIVGGKGAGKVVVGGRAVCVNSAIQDIQESMQTYHVGGVAKAVVNGKKEHLGGERGLPDLVGSSPVPSRRRGKSEGGGVRNGEDASSLAPLSVGSSPVAQTHADDERWRGGSHPPHLAL